MEYAHHYLVLATGFGFLLAWGMGANDVSNAMGTSVGSRALTLRQAVIIAAIFECLGALFVGGEVSQTIRSDIISPEAQQVASFIIVHGMLAALLAAGVWLAFASIVGWPVSTTHTIIGAILGFTIWQLGWHAVQWGSVTNIILSWVLTPIIAGLIAFMLFRSVQRLILEQPDPVAQAKHYVPYYIFIAMLIVSIVTLEIGLTHWGIELPFWQSGLVTVIASTLTAYSSQFFLKKIHRSKRRRRSFDFKTVEKIFAILMVFTACVMAFAHGSNDVANAIGPVAAIVSIVGHQGEIVADNHIPVTILALGAVGIVIGLLTYGYRVMATIGENITELTPSRGFAATLSTAGTVVIASGTGLPVSTTQTLVGAILGVGLARGIGALRLSVIRNIFLSWLITLPAGALLAIIFYEVIARSFG